MVEVDHALAFLVSLDGQEFRMATGHTVKIAAHLVEATRNRPQGVKYSLTLHDQANRRIYGIDNAHGVSGQPAFDHRHTYGRRVVRYNYTDAAPMRPNCWLIFTARSNAF